jgi:hypothetical protein
MWSLTPDYLANMKEELKGRRAAIQARIADELKAIDADLEEIETLERVAYAFAVKHLPEPQQAPASEADTKAEAEVEGEPKSVAMLQAQSAEPEGRERADVGKGGISRWRMRLDKPVETEKA